MEEVLSTKSHNKDVWYLPGGKRKTKESDIAAFTREIRKNLID